MLTLRQRHILTVVIESYISNPLPVGSKSISGHGGLNISPASVRNEMGMLEDMGYLTHPHTSAGRVPTDMGYQFYVKEVVKEEPLQEELVNFISRELAARIKKLESLTERACQILSAMAEEAVLVSLPRGTIPRVFVEGSRYILNQPEFQDLKKLQLLISTLEEKTSLARLLDSYSSEEGVHVAIGERELSKDMWDCSLISAPYHLHGRRMGTVGVLGPRRMRYGKMMSLVHQMTEELNQNLERWGS